MRAVRVRVVRTGVVRMRVVCETKESKESKTEVDISDKSVEECQLTRELLQLTKTAEISVPKNILSLSLSLSLMHTRQVPPRPVYAIVPREVQRRERRCLGRRPEDCVSRFALRVESVHRPVGNLEGEELLWVGREESVEGDNRLGGLMAGAAEEEMAQLGEVGERGEDVVGVLSRYIQEREELEGRKLQ